MQASDGGPAFPQNRPYAPYDRDVDGMSLRDWFAGQALAFLSGEYQPHGDADERAKMHAARLAAHAYNISDAMLAARGAK